MNAKAGNDRWDAENRLASVSSGPLTESYTYDADSERLTKVSTLAAVSTTTVYLQGLWEETLSGGVKRSYAFNGQTIAVRDSATANAVTYLHGDQLGSVGLATDALGNASAQFFRPWGDARGGSIGATSLNFTGQRLDGTGLLYYHARYYDPALARFLTPDTVTADPGDPQHLNRYSYVRNNPVRYNDPSGHCLGWLWGAPDCRLARSTSELDVEGALDNVQTGLDVAGMIPVAGEALDLANAGISAARGNYGEAALSLAAMAPIGGQAAGVGKLTVKYGDEAAAVLKHADEVVPAISKSADEAAAVIKGACSFSADTPVVTANGAVAIGDLRLGDHVLAWDEATDTTGSYTVTAVLVHPDPLLVHLTLDTEQME